MTQTDYPLGEYPYGYDIPEYIYQFMIDQNLIKQVDRKNKIQLTDEEKERMRKLASTNYYENIEKRRLQQALNHQRVKNAKAQTALIL